MVMLRVGTITLTAPSAAVRCSVGAVHVRASAPSRNELGGGESERDTQVKDWA